MEIVIEENKDNKTTFRIDKYSVIFSDYDVAVEDFDIDEDEPIAVFSMSHEAFELAIKAWRDYGR